MKFEKFQFQIRSISKPRPFSDFASLTVTLPELLGTNELWPIAFGLPGIPAFFLLCALPFFPETPRFTYITRNNLQDTKKALQFYQRTCDQTLIDELEKEKQDLNSKRFRATDIIRRSRNRNPLIVVLIMTIMGIQLSGISVIMAYSTSMFMSAGLSEHLAKYATVGVGLCNFSVAFIAIYTVEKFGRRILL